MVNIRLSIRQRLTLLICTLLAVAIALYGFVNYYSLKKTTLAFATERLRSLTDQVSTSFGQSNQLTINNIKAAAANPAVNGYLRKSKSIVKADVLTVLDKLHRDSNWIVEEVLDSNYNLILRSTTTNIALPVDNHQAIMQAGVTPDSAFLGKMYNIDDTVYFPIISAVGKDTVTGYIICWVRVKATPKAVEQFSKLVGIGAQFYMSNMDGSLWTDLMNPLYKAPFSVPRADTLINFTDDSSRNMIAVVQKVPHSNWYVGLGVSMDNIMQGITGFLKWIVISGVLLIVCGIAAAWLMSRNITMPLNKLTKAVTSVAGDNYMAPAEVEVNRNDELGKLAGAFNAMAKEVYKTHRDLEDTVAKRTRQLEELNSELKGFSYSVSHDLRAPLTTMQGFAKMLKEDYGEHLNAEAEGVIQKIVYNAGVMARLMDDLLAFSQLENTPVKRESIDMHDLAMGVLGELLQNAPADKYHVRIASLPPVVADAAMLRLVMVNLVDNAIKYSSKKEHPIIEVGDIEEGQKIIFYVKDNGVGFNMNDVDKLFVVFQRLHSQKDFEGTGVGLALVQRIIEKHGGQIWAEAKEGEGATFYFTLPRQ